MSLDYDTLLRELGLEDGTETRTPSKIEHSSPESKIRVILNVSLSKYKNEQLKIYSDDDPKVRVTEFCRKHNLSPEANRMLMQQVYNTSTTYNNQSFSTNNHTPYSSNKKPIKHPGERLHKLASIKQEQRKKVIEEVKNIESETLLNNLLDRPQLTTNTQIITKRMGYTNGYMRDKKQLNAHDLYHDQSECTFQPQIDEVSKQLIQFTRAQSEQYDNIFDDLYARARNKQLSNEKEKIPDNQPQISQFEFQDREIIQNEFLLRMQKQAEIKKEKQDIQKLRVESIDSNTNQLLFRPKVGRGPKKERDNNMCVYEQLYQQSIDKKKRLENKIQEKEIQDSRQSGAIQNQLSQDIVFKQRKRILEQIFEQLDINRDGYIGCDKNEISQLDHDIVTLLWPVFKQINEEENQKDFEDFFEMAYSYVLTLPQVDKDKLFIRYQSKEQSFFTFQPKTNTMKNCSLGYKICQCDICLSTLELKRQLDCNEFN